MINIEALSNNPGNLPDVNTTLLNASKDPGLHQFLVDSGIEDPLDEFHPDYWIRVAQWAHVELSGSTHEQTESQDDIDFAKILTLSLPGFYLAQYALSHDKANLDPKTHKEYKRLCCATREALLKTIMSSLDTLSRKDMQKHLESIAQTTFGQSRDIAYINNETQRTIRGAMHESGFIQLIESIEGFEIVETTYDDDAAGVDVKVATPQGKIVEIDVKASIDQISGARGGEAHLWAISRHGNILLWSLLTDSDFKNGFKVPDSTLQERAPLMAKTLQEIQLDNVA